MPPSARDAWREHGRAAAGHGGAVGADPAVALVGLPLPPLSGTVTGFVTGETLANATTGTLRFDVLSAYVKQKGTLTPLYDGRRVVIGGRSRE